MNNRTEVKLETEIECPECGYKTTVTMPEDACVYFWECPDCGSIVRPQQGDCCVFCSYGTVSCPPVQRGESC